MNILDKLLNKRGIKDPSELKEEERVIYDQWKSIISKEELTLADLKNFCETQLAVIENRWQDYSVEQRLKNELLPYYTVYRTLLKVIDSPKQAREALEVQLNQLLNQ